MPNHTLAIETRSLAPLVVALVVLTSFCGFLFGYDTGYISGALVVVGNDLGHPLTDGDKEFITSATSLGAFITAIIGGSLADAFGRKWIITGANVLFIAGAIIQVCAHTLWTMISGRFVMGFGVGLASLVAPLYISETAPSRFRGRLVVLNVLAITFGQLVAYAIGAGLNKVPNGWRVMVGLSLVPSAAQMVVFAFMPETPRHLVRRGRAEEARRVLQRVYHQAGPEQIEAKLEDLTVHMAGLGSGVGVNRLVRSLRAVHTGANMRALVITCGLQGIQQFSGWNAFVYFSATVFESVGFNNPTAVSIIISGTNFVFTIVAFLIIDRVGRRRLLLYTIWGMAGGLALTAVAFHFVPFDPNGSSTNVNGPSSWAIVIIVSTFIFAAFYATGIGNVPWQQSELFSMDVRGIGTSFATATNWAGSLVVSSTFLTMLTNISPPGTYALFAGLCVVGQVFVYFLYPETAGLTLEEVQTLLTGGFNVKLSMKMYRDRRRYFDDALKDKETLQKSDSLKDDSILMTSNLSSDDRTDG